MKLISAELRKLFASRSLVFLLVLLALDFVLTAFLARPLPVEKAAREVYEIYLAEPETLIEYKKQLEENFFEHLRDDLFEMPSTFTEGADDLSVLSRVLDRADYIENYRAEISEIADSAARRAEDLLYFGYSEDSYYVREQRRLRDVYSELADALDGVSEYAYGYDAYLEGGRVCLFITVWLIFSVSFVFRNDRVCGFGSIMRTARCGRLDTAFSKLAAALLIGVVSTLLFLGTDFVAVYLAQGGFSSPSMPIQSLPDYAEVPFETTILGFIALVTAFRVAAAIILVLFVALISSIGFNYVSVFGISSLFAAANYFVFSRDYHGSAPAIKYLNIAAAAEGVELFAFGRYLSVFGKPTAYTAIFIPLAAAVAVVFTAFSVFIYCKNPKLPSPSFKRLSLNTVYSSKHFR